MTFQGHAGATSLDVPQPCHPKGLVDCNSLLSRCVLCVGTMSQDPEKVARIMTCLLLCSCALPSVEDTAHLLEGICRAVVLSGVGEVLAAFDLGEHL